LGDSAPAALSFIGGREKSVEKSQIPHSNAPIIIHAPSPVGISSIKSTVISYALGAGACWVGFFMITNMLPDAVKEFFPVTRKFFENTSNTLGKCIINVKVALEEKFTLLSKKQDTLEQKQDDTITHVLDVKDEVGEARADLSTLGYSLKRCEKTLTTNKNMQCYTNRGVKLLVQCVATILPGNDGFISDLSQFLKDGEESHLLASDDSPKPRRELHRTHSLPITSEEDPVSDRPSRKSFGDSPENKQSLDEMMKNASVSVH